MIRRNIEAILLIVGLILTVAIVIAIPLKSYIEYKDYLAAIEQQREENEQAHTKPALESISIDSEPTKTIYEVGSKFSDEGMVVRAHFDDGSSRILSSDEYAVDRETPLTLDDKEVIVSYGTGENIKTVSVAISVCEKLEN